MASRLILCYFFTTKQLTTHCINTKHTQYHKHGVHVAEILKAGSLGQQTAVLGNFDVDLVVYSDSKLIKYISAGLQ